MKYSIYEAKARLSEVVRNAKARRRVIITERGVPVAEIIPYAGELAESLSRRIARLSKLGAIMPHKEPFHPEPVSIHKGAVRRFLTEDRD
jgi:prevent-host-death family protein